MVTKKNIRFPWAEKKCMYELYLSSCTAHGVAVPKVCFFFYKYICKKMYILYI